LSRYYSTLVWASGAGLAAAVVWHVLTLVGVEVSRSLWIPLFTAMFPLWLAAIVSAGPVNDRIVADPHRAWKIVLEGAPTWMRLAPLYLSIYGMVNGVLATGELSRMTDRNPNFPRVGSAVIMVFYGTGMAMLYAAGKREHAVRCSEGHFIYPGQDVCPVCGQLPDRGHSTSTRHGA